MVDNEPACAFSTDSAGKWLADCTALCSALDLYIIRSEINSGLVGIYQQTSRIYPVFSISVSFNLPFSQACTPFQTPRLTLLEQAPTEKHLAS